MLCKILLHKVSISLTDTIYHFHKAGAPLKTANKKEVLVFVLILITDNACLYLSLIPWHCTNQRVTETQALIHVNELLFSLFFLI